MSAARAHLLRWLVLSAGLVVAACGDEGPRGLGWRLVFDPPSLEARARGYEASILTGRCGEATRSSVYTSRAARDQDFTGVPPVLQPGAWSFEARAMDDRCAWYAQGCVDVTLPREPGDVVVVRLEAIGGDPPNACAGSQRCEDGACRDADGGPAPDAGGPDSGIDSGPPPDAGEPDGGGAPDSGVDAGPDAGGCPSGFADCNGVVGDGCEQRLDALSDCGACDTPCSLLHAVESCVTETCEIVDCDTGWDDCDGNAANGCEGCEGGCGDGPCAIPGARESCNAGVCEFGGCEARFDDCNANLGDGCEADLWEDESDCGACDVVCGGGDECHKGDCAPD